MDLNGDINILVSTLKGEIYTDNYTLGMYATDASHYQVFPKAVVLPKNELDILNTIKFCNENKIPLLPRGGATSLAGQTVSDALILDVSKYCNQILEYNPKEKWAWVQPGVICDQLNRKVANDNLIFAPDPATASRANIGGMIANNTSGTKSILYGKTSDHVLEMKIALMDGTVHHLRPYDMEDLDSDINLDPKLKELFTDLRKIIFEQSDDIVNRFPKTMRRVSGYALDAFVGKEEWNLCELICGSEGTLAVILAAKVNLVDLPRAKRVCAVHFKDEIEAVKSLPTILKFDPAAIETLDKVLIRMSKENLETKAYSHFIEGMPESIQIVEFFGESEVEVEERMQEMINNLQQDGFGYAYPYFSPGKAYEDVWTIRKKGLGLLLGRSDNKKAAAVIEDAAIPLEHLTDYTQEVLAIHQKYNVEMAIYGHASVGVLHLRPFLDMMAKEDVDKFQKISRETFELVRKYGGSWSSEHGDGRVRGPYIREYYGDEIYGAFKAVKALFDPDHLLNPGNIIDVPPMDQHLRYGSHGYEDPKVDTVYRYRKGNNFQHLIHNCTGVGECRKVSGGTMCPSYRATRDEEHSTRGRANALRLTMEGTIGDGDLTNDRLLEVLDLCLSCKACKSECPSNVDMAKLKSEILQKKYDAGKINRREKFIRDAHKMAHRLSGKWAPIVNAIQGSTIFRNVLSQFSDITPQRKLPSYSSDSLLKWYEKEYVPPLDMISEVVFFADTYVKYHEVEVGKAAIKLLRDCGYHIRLADVGCCQRPRISNGFLKLAATDGETTIKNMKDLISLGVPIVACEPSCVSALQDDLPDLIEDEKLALKMQNQVMTIADFLANEYDSERCTKPLISHVSKIVVHGHCHEKSLYGLGALKSILDRVEDLEYHVLDTGCCGMAGAFGYEKEHYDISVKVAEDSLIPQLNQYPDAAVIANGFSCRHQIIDLTGRKAIHWVEALGCEL